MAKYLLDTNAYFALLKHVVMDEKNETIESLLKGECYISKLTEIEIISVIGKYARGCSGGTQECDRIHVSTNLVCGKTYIIKKQKRWSREKLKIWLKLVKEISSGVNPLIKIAVLDIDADVISEAKVFINHALTNNFGSMDAMIFGTAKAYSSDAEKMIVVTADKGLKAGMDKILYPHISIT